MSLIIIICLVAIGLVFLFVMRENEHAYIKKEDYEYNHIYKQHCREMEISEIASTCLAGYSAVLIIAAIGCLGVGIYWWLKNGAWLTVSPEFLLNTLSSSDSLKDILLYETKWVGINKINAWYMHSNLAWTFLFTYVVLMLFYAFTTKRCN